MSQAILTRRGGAGTKNKIVRCAYETVQAATRIDVSHVAVFFAPANPTCVVFPQMGIYLRASENAGMNASLERLYDGIKLSYGSKGDGVYYYEGNGTPYVTGGNRVTLVFGYTK